MTGEKITADDVKRILANPFYCIEIHKSLCEPHEPTISEEDWIKASVVTIKDIGAEEFLKELIENLKGNYIK